MSDREDTLDTQTDSVSRSYRIINELGLHLRPASQLVEIFSSHPDCEVHVSADGGARVNGKSIMGLLMLEAAQGAEILVECAGPGGPDILERVEKVIATRFGEP